MNEFRVGDWVKVVDGSYENAIGRVTGMYLCDNQIASINVELYVLPNQPSKNVATYTDTFAPSALKLIDENTPRLGALHAGDRVMVQPTAKAYQGKYACVKGRVIQTYKRRPDAKQTYGVRLDDRNNLRSGNGLFWFDEDELVHLAHQEDSLDALAYATAYFNRNKLTTEGINNMRSCTIKKVIFSGPKTIVLWEDGTKTIVSLREGDQADCYAAFCQAVVKKIFGSTSRAKKILDEKAVVQPSKKEWGYPITESNSDPIASLPRYPDELWADIVRRFNEICNELRDSIEKETKKEFGEI